MNKHYDLAVYIGRFQPFHVGHEHVIHEAMQIADRVLVLVGDTGGPRTVKNPWTFEERSAMIKSAFVAQSQPGLDRPALVNVEQLFDHPNDTFWINRVRGAVAQYADAGAKITLVGHEKDISSKYLRWFDPWDFTDTGFASFGDVPTNVDATTIRQFYFDGHFSYARGVLPNRTFDLIQHFERFGNKEAFDELREEYKHIAAYKKSWSAAPFPPTFMTTDAVVVQSGQVLMVRRKDSPGKGLLALPGGFLGIDESMEDSMLRELFEETNIKLQEDTLHRCIVASKVFDDPNRSLRGRTITNAFLIKLNDTAKLPKVKGGDDAAEAMWIPINELDPRKVFEDHYHIIIAMLQYV